MRHAVTVSLAAVMVCAVAAAQGQDWQAAIAQLRDPSPKLRLEAVQHLQTAANPAAADYLAPLVTDADDEVQDAAIDAELSFFLNQAIAGDASRSRAQAAFDAGPTVRAALRAPAVVVDALITATADRNPRVRFDAIHALGVIAEAPVTAEEGQRIAAGLQHSDLVMRAATARVLGRLRVASAGDALIAALNDKSEIVQQCAAEALGDLRSERAVQALIDRANYFGKGARANEALMALARIGHPASRDLLRARLADPDADARRAAVEGVARLNDRASLDRVRAIATNDSSNAVRLAGLFALDRLGEPQLSLMVSLVGRPGLSAQTAGYLLEIGAPAAPAVSAGIGTAVAVDAKVQLIHILGVIGSAGDVRTLDPLTRAADAAVAHAAQDALARLRR